MSPPLNNAPANETRFRSPPLRSATRRSWRCSTFSFAAVSRWRPRPSRHANSSRRRRARSSSLFFHRPGSPRRPPPPPRRPWRLRRRRRPLPKSTSLTVFVASSGATSGSWGTAVTFTPRLSRTPPPVGRSLPEMISSRAFAAAVVADHTTALALAQHQRRVVELPPRAVVRLDEVLAPEHGLAGASTSSSLLVALFVVGTARAAARRARRRRHGASSGSTLPSSAAASSSVCNLMLAVRGADPRRQVCARIVLQTSLYCVTAAALPHS